jgi:hypothetical protein
MGEVMFLHVTRSGHFLSKPTCTESVNRENGSQYAWKELYSNYSDIRMMTVETDHFMTSVVD